MDASTTVVLENLEISGGQAPQDAAGDAQGGGIYTSGNLELDNVVLENSNAGGANGSAGQGGGIYGGAGGTGFSGLGGGIYVAAAGGVTLNNSTLSNDIAQGGGGGGGGAGGLGGTGGTGGAGLGGGIYVAAAGGVTLNNSTLSNDIAQGGGGGGAGTGGTGVIGGTGGAGQGGGIYVAAAGGVTLNSSTLANDKAQGGVGGVGGTGGAGGIGGAGLGGGLASDGTATLTNCTVSGNSTYSQGGGLEIYSGTATLTNCTVSGNSAGEFGGGVLNAIPTNTVTLNNTIVAGNTTSPNGSGSPADITGSVSGSYNLIGTGGSGGLSNGVDNNLVGVANPVLGTLGNYGGPTQTIPLLPGSLAIGKGDPAQAGTTDQRGYTRGSSVDIGAFESQGFTLSVVPGSTPQTAAIGTAFANPLAVTVTANNPIEPVNGGVVTFVAQPAANGASAIFPAPTAVITNGQAAVTAAPDNITGSYSVVASASGLSASFQLTNVGTPLAALIVNTTSDSIAPGPGLLSLREAVGFADTAPSGNSNITFDVKVFKKPEVITLTGNQLELSNTTGTVSITGPKAGVTVSGGGTSRVFQVDGGVTANFSSLTITGGSTANNGGGLYNDGGSATLTDCTVSGNSATGSGGGVNVNGGTATLTDCTISGNTSGKGSRYGGYGGGLSNRGGNVTLTNCTISGNTVEDGSGGGGLATLTGGTTTLTNCTISGNSAAARSSSCRGWRPHRIRIRRADHADQLHRQR